ncbi:hypothetical protein MMPV_003015 [Pyropia vietnamensis]
MGSLQPRPASSPNPPSPSDTAAAARPLSAAAATPHAVPAVAALDVIVRAEGLSPASQPSSGPAAAPSSRCATGGEPTADGVALLDRLDTYAKAVLEYHEPSVREQVRQVIPPEVLAAAACVDADKDAAPVAGRSAAAATDGGDSAPPTAAAPTDLTTCPDMHLTRALLTWFKTDFFSWVDTLPCDSCGHATTVTDTVGPSDEESAWRASRVELHVCSACGAVTRFARFAHPLKLLTTRRGRCGEWAQAFTAIAVAAGLTARLIVDSTDHLWTEVWSHTAQQWVHADACEAALDTPLLYEAGWGKRLAYILAAGEGVGDVTRRYTARFSEVAARRTLMGEAVLTASLARLNAAALAALPPGGVRDAAVSRGIADLEALHSGGGATRVPSTGEGEERTRLPGRQSGAADWVHSRGEDGEGYS